MSTNRGSSLLAPTGCYAAALHPRLAASAHCSATTGWTVGYPGRGVLSASGVTLRTAAAPPDGAMGSGAGAGVGCLLETAARGEMRWLSRRGDSAEGSGR